MERLKRFRTPTAMVALSLVLHLLALILWQPWEQPVEKAPIRFERAVDRPPLRFSAESPQPGPSGVWEKVPVEKNPLVIEAEEPALPQEVAELKPSQLETEVEIGSPAKTQQGEKAELDLNQQALESVRKHSEDRQGYRILALPDADTTDAQSRNRNRAEAIVDRAIEAMGGLERLLAIKGKRVERWVQNPQTQKWSLYRIYHYWRGQKYREEFQPEILRGFDGRTSWFWRFGVLRPPPDLRYQTERWDFISQFKGAEIRLRYLGEWSQDGRHLDVIEVEDLRYGRLLEAYFDRQTGLLYRTAGADAIHYRQYQPVQGVLLPHLFSKNNTLFRDEVQLLEGFASNLFTAPPPKTWEPEHIVKTLLDTYPHSDEDLPEMVFQILPTVQLFQMPVRCTHRADQTTLELIDTFLRKKLKTVDYVNTEAVWRIRPEIVKYYSLCAIKHPTYFLTVRVILEQPPSFEQSFVTEFKMEWEASGNIYTAIDDRLADNITYKIISAVGLGLGHIPFPTYSSQ